MYLSLLEIFLNIKFFYLQYPFDFGGIPIPEILKPMDFVVLSRCALVLHRRSRTFRRKRFGVQPTNVFLYAMAGASEKDGTFSFVYLGVVMSVIIPISGLHESFGILLPVFVDYFDETNSKVAWVGSISHFIQAFTYIPSVFLRRHVPVRLIFLGAAILLVIAFLSTPLMPTLGYLYLSYSVPFGLGSGFINCVTILTLYEVFDQYIGFAIALRFTATSIGAIAWSYLLPIFVESFGWRKTFVAISSISVACILIAMVYRQPVMQETFEEHLIGIDLDTTKKFNCLNCGRSQDEDKDSVNVKDGDRNGDREGNSENDGIDRNANGNVGTYRDQDKNNVDEENRCGHKKCSAARSIDKEMEKDVARKKEQGREQNSNEKGESEMTSSGKRRSYGFLRNKWFLLTSLGCLLTALTMAVPPTFIVQYSKTLGHPLSESKWLLSIRGMSMLITQLVFSRAGDVFLRHRKVCWVMTAGVALFGISTGLCSLTQSLPLMLVYTAFFGGVEGLYWMFFPLRVTEMTSGKNMEDLYSCLMLTSGIGYLTGPPLAGWLLDLTGDFRKVLYATSAVALVASFLTSLDVCVTSSFNEFTVHAESINSEGCFKSIDIEQTDITEKSNIGVLPDMLNFEVAMLERSRESYV